MATGNYCQICGKKKRLGSEIIADAHGVAVTSPCLFNKVYGAQTAGRDQVRAMVKFCARCGAEQPAPPPDRCGACGAALFAEIGALDLKKIGDPAPLQLRVLAFLIDLVPIAVLAWPGVPLLAAATARIAEPGAEPAPLWELYLASLAVAFILYHGLLVGLLGLTVGKLAMGLRVVLIDGTSKIGPMCAFIRAGLYLLTLYVLAIGFILLVLQEPRAKWLEILEQDALFHNPLTDTVVIVKKG